MHIKPEVEPLPLDTEMERTLRNLRKDKSVESTTMENHRKRIQPIPEKEEAKRPQRKMTMEDFGRPVIQDEYSTVRHPAIEANNFVLKLALITMVQQHQFIEHPSEDPNEHMGIFMRMANTVKLNAVRSEVIMLKLFPFSLRDVAAAWFESLPVGSVNT